MVDRCLHGSSVGLKAASQMGSNHPYAQAAAAASPGDREGCSIEDLLYECCTAMLDQDFAKVFSLSEVL